MTSLLSAVSRYADAHADENGIAPTPVPGLLTVRATAPSGLQHDVLRPLICLVVQGSKHVTTGKQGFHFSAGESLLITADVPTVSQITRASIAAPYYSLVLELDPAVIAELVAEMDTALVADLAPIRVDPTDVEVADSAMRLMRLLDRPASIPVLREQLRSEEHTSELQALMRI